MKRRTGKFTKIIFILQLMLSFFIFSTVFADSETRQATQAEKEFDKTVLSVFSKSVPPGPDGWDQTGGTKINKELDRVTIGTEENPLKVEYAIAWQDTKRIEDAQAQLNKELIQLSKNPPVSDKKLSDLSKKMAPHDVTVKIEIRANELSLGIHEKISPAPAIAGGLVYRSEGAYKSSSGWREGATYILLGKNWTLRGKGRNLTTTAAKGVPHTRVQTIAVIVRADAERARQIVQKIDWGALQRLIGK